MRLAINRLRRQKLRQVTSVADSAVPSSPVTPVEDGDSQLGSEMKNREQALIIEALQAENGRRKEAAARLGISPRTLRYKLAKLREQGIAIPGLATA